MIKWDKYFDHIYCYQVLAIHATNQVLINYYKYMTRYSPADFVWNSNLFIFNEDIVTTITKSFAVNNIGIQKNDEYLENYSDIQHLKLSDYCL